MKRRVVITGMGTVTSLGIGIERLWDSIKAGVSGISIIERFDVSDLPTKVAAEIKDFNPKDFIGKKEIKRMDRYAQYAVAAADLAIEDSQLNLDKENKEQIGIIIGTGIGGIETFANQHNVLMEKGFNRVSPFFIPMMLPNMASGLIAIRYGIKGFNECVVSACASSVNSIGDAYKAIQHNIVDLMIAGGAEAPITKLSLAGFNSSKAISTADNPVTACRPFDMERNGFVMGEGAGVIILEELEHALKRGAKIIAEVVGYGCTNDAFHITAPAKDGDGSAMCMKLAIKDAELNYSDIHYINAHGSRNDNGYIYYLPSVQVTDLEHIPEGMTGITIPAHKYVVFRFIGFFQPEEIRGRQVGRLLVHMYSKWIYNSGFKFADTFRFEYIDTSLSRDNYCELDIYQPVEDV